MGAERPVLIILHILGASIWIGGMLILALGVLPKAKKAKSSAILRNFEGSFHILGMTALTVQLLTGFRIAMIYAGGMKYLFDFTNHAAVLFVWKMLFIILTMVVFVLFKKKTLANLTDENVSSASAMVWVLALLAIGLMILGLGFSRGIV
jgi:putative copper export protein